MRTVLFFVVGVLVLSAAAGAARIPGVDNEVVNGGFEQELAPAWEAALGEVTRSDYAHSGNYSVQCDLNTEGWGDTIRQVIDNSKSSKWNPNFHDKVIDLEAWISIDTKSHQEGGIRFGIDWWDESYNNSDTAPSINDPGYHAVQESEWRSYMKSQGYGWQFAFVEPFTDFHIVDDAGHRIQPRWISIEIQFWQPNNVINRVDDVWLTSECVPEPSALISLAVAVTGFWGLSIRRRRK